MGFSSLPQKFLDMVELTASKEQLVLNSHVARAKKRALQLSEFLEAKQDRSWVDASAMIINVHASITCCTTHMASCGGFLMIGVPPNDPSTDGVFP